MPFLDREETILSFSVQIALPEEALAETLPWQESQLKIQSQQSTLGLKESEWQLS
jgi:hypothetical protein